MSLVSKAIPLNFTSKDVLLARYLSFSGALQGGNDYEIFSSEKTQGHTGMQVHALSSPQFP